MTQAETASFEAARQRYTITVPGTDGWVAAWETFEKAITSQWRTSGAPVSLDALIDHYLDLPELAPSEKKSTAWMVNRLDVIITTIKGLESPRHLDLERATLLSRLSLEHVPGDQPALRALTKARMAELLLRSYDIYGDTTKLTTAVDEVEEAANIVVVEHSDRCEILTVLGIALRQRYNCLGEHEDLNASVAATRSSLEALPREELVSQSPRCLALYQNLANALGQLFDISGDPQHLDESIECGYKSLAGGPNGEDADSCNSLVSSLTTRARLKNEVEDLDNAVSIMDKLAVLLSPRTSSRQRVSIYDHWARALQARYEITNQLQDLETAISIGEKAVALFGNFQESKYKASTAHEMLILYTKKYKRSRKLDDALKGVRYGEMSIQLQTPGSRKLGEHIGQLAILYETMFFNTQKREYLHQAVSRARKGLQFTPNSAIAQNNMACKYLVLYKIEGTQGDLDLALNHITLAFSASEGKRLTRGALLSTAGEAYRLKYEASVKGTGGASEAEEYLVKAIDYFTQSAKHPTSMPLKRVEAARLAAKLLARQCRWESAYQLLHEAMEWIPKLVPIHMNSKEQMAIVTSFSGLAAEACSAALACGRVREAVEDLEMGRGILVAASHKALNDIDKLQERDPGLFWRYCRTRDQLLGLSNRVESEAKGAQVDLDGDLTSQAAQLPFRVEVLNTQMENILKEIHSIPGFHKFLEPILSGEMQELCGTKCVVALNASKFGAHAIFVNKERIWFIPLPDPPYIQNFAGRLQAGVRVMESIVHSSSDDDWISNNNSLQGLLATLWHHIAGPVVKELGFHDGGSFAPELMFSRRILWLPTGHYSQFPIHAAGLHDGNGKDTLVGRYVLSTYIASFRLLRFAQSIDIGLPRRSGKGLILSMEPPGRTSENPLYLPNAAVEVEEITKEASTMIDWEVIQRPTHAKALNSIGTCSWLHVASHGVSDSTDPSASFLHLEADEDDAANAGKGSRLTVHQISELGAKQGILAFLSACSTAESKVAPFLDESLSIGYAFQVAGFPHVVGCLWPAYEFICPDFVAFFYAISSSMGVRQADP